MNIRSATVNINKLYKSHFVSKITKCEPFMGSIKMIH